MDFIDINCVIGPWTYGNLFIKDTGSLIREMDRLGIKFSFVFDSRSWLNEIVSGNRMIVEEAGKHSDRLIPVIVLTPLIEKEFHDLRDFMKANPIGAVKLFPMQHNYTLNIWNVEKLFSMLEELQIPVLIDAWGFEETAGPYFQQVFELANHYKALDIIMLKTGYGSLRIIYEMFDRCANIHMDISTFNTFHGIKDIVRYFGSGRILFGSAMPFIEGGVAAGRLIYADISEKDKQAIAYGNALALIRKNRCLGMEKGGGKVEI